jgi:hypothetical protein
MILKSLARGSVVDGLTVPDFASVHIPYPDDLFGKALGDRAVAAWDQFAQATKLEQDAAGELEGALS